MSAAFRDEVVRFGPEDGLVGILRRPDPEAAGRRLPAFVLSNSGLVHRMGPQRLYVKLAERLTALGYPVLRFDFSGIGDSATRNDRMPFDESAVAEQRDAMDHLAASLGVEAFVVMGICSGARVSFDTARIDDRVVGAIPINAGLHLHIGADAEMRRALFDQAQSKHFWRMALFSSFSRKNWRKALTAQLDVVDRAKVMLSGLFKRSEPAPAVSTVPAEAIGELERRGVRMLHVYSEGDEWLDYFQTSLADVLPAWSEDHPMRLEIVRGADHTFTMLWSQAYLMDLICRWAEEQSWARG